MDGVRDVFLGGQVYLNFLSLNFETAAFSEISSDTPSMGNSSQTTEFDELFALTPSESQKSSSPKMGMLI